MREIYLFLILFIYCITNVKSKVNQNHGGVCIDSLDWIKTKKGPVNFINDNDNAFNTL